MRAGIQSDLISAAFPGFRVSPHITRLARNDSIVELRHRPRLGNDSMGCCIAFSEIDQFKFVSSNKLQKLFELQAIEI